MNVLITGCNRGLGLEFVKQFLSEANTGHVFATCRMPAKAAELQKLKAQHPDKLHILTLEVTNLSSYQDIANQVSSVVGSNGLNLLINNAGVQPQGMREKVTAIHMRKAFEVNTIAPYFLSIELLPLLKKASENRPNEAIGVNRAAIIMISSFVSSLENANQDRRALAYRASKTALNMTMKNLASEVKRFNILVASFCPGWVKTDMGTEEAEIEVDVSVSKLLKAFKGLNVNDHGSFKDNNGIKIPW